MSNYDYISVMGDPDWRLPCNLRDDLTLYDCKHCPYYGGCDRGAHIISALLSGNIDALPIELRHRLYEEERTKVANSDIEVFDDGVDDIDDIDDIDNFDDIEEYKGGLLPDWLKD